MGERSHSLTYVRKHINPGKLFSQLGTYQGNVILTKHHSIIGKTKICTLKQISFLKLIKGHRKYGEKLIS